METSDEQLTKIKSYTGIAPKSLKAWQTVVGILLQKLDKLLEKQTDLKREHADAVKRIEHQRARIGELEKTEKECRLTYRRMKRLKQENELLKKRLAVREWQQSQATNQNERPCTPPENAE